MVNCDLNPKVDWYTSIGNNAQALLNTPHMASRIQAMRYEGTVLANSYPSLLAACFLIHGRSLGAHYRMRNNA